MPISTIQTDDNDLKELVVRFKAGREHGGRDFPTDPWKQLDGAIGAVFGAWMTIAPSCTGANTAFLQSGNRRQHSGDGVRQHWGAIRLRVNSRAIPHLAKGLLRRISVNTGRDVVAGVRTPEPVAALRIICHLLPNWKFARHSNGTSRTCRTLSSRSRTASSSCFRRGTANEQALRLSASPLKWKRRS